MYPKCSLSASKMIHKLFGNLRMVLLIQVGLPVLVLLGTVLMLGLGFINTLAEERLQNDLKQVARAIRLPVSTALETKNFDQLNTSVESVFYINEVYGAYLFDANGNFLVSLGAVEPSQAQANRAIEKTLHGEFEQYESISGRNVYSFFMPLFDVSGRPSGLLQVTRLKSGIEDELREIRLVAWSGFGLVAVLIILVLTWAHRRAIGAHPVIRHNLLPSESGRLVPAMEQVGLPGRHGRLHCLCRGAHPQTRAPRRARLPGQDPGRPGRDRPQGVHESEHALHRHGREPA